MTQSEIKNSIEQYLRVNNVEASELTFTYDEAIYNGKTIFAMDHESPKFILYTIDGDIIAEPEEMTMMDCFYTLAELCYCNDCDNNGRVRKEHGEAICECPDVLFKIRW